MKTCAGCGETKPLDEFNRRKSSRDGRQSYCRDCTRAYKASHYAANRDEALKYAAQYRTDNWERISELKPERDRKYYAAHREKLRASGADYYSANPHLWWKSLAKKRSQWFGTKPTIEDFTRDDVIKRYGEQCFHCGGPFEQLDHYPVPMVRGGDHTLENVKPSCAPCNSKSWRPGFNKKDVGRTA